MSFFTTIHVKKGHMQ